MNRWQVVPKEQRYTAKQFDVEFPTDDASLEYVMERRWPGGKTLRELGHPAAGGLKVNTPASHTGVKRNNLLSLNI